MNIPIGKRFGEWFVEPSGWMVQWKIDQTGQFYEWYDVEPYRFNNPRLIVDMQRKRDCDFENFLDALEYAKGL